MTKRRGHGEGAVFQRERDGKWCAVINLGFVHGKRRRKTRVAATRAGAVRALRRMQDEIDGGATQVDSRITVEKWCLRWLDGDVAYRLAAGRLRPATAESYERLIRCHVVPHLGRVALAKLDTGTIQRAYNAMLAHGLAPSTVEKVHIVLRSALDDAVRDQVLVVNHCRRVEPPRVPRVEVEPLTLEQVKAILDATAGTLDHGLWAVMAFCGLRLGEALALRRRDLDLDTRILSVTRTLGQGKGGCDSGRRRAARADAPSRSWTTPS